MAGLTKKIITVRPTGTDTGTVLCACQSRVLV